MTYERMICPYCRIEIDVKVTRHQTASPQHTDLECKCPCGQTWQAAEVQNVRT